MVFTTVRVFARVLFFSALFAALMLSSLVNQASAAGVDPKGQPLSSRAEDPAPTPEEAIKKFAVNITELAKSGKAEPFVGKEDRIIRVSEILARRGIRTMIFVGESGSGKTALIEQVAGRLDGKVFYTLNLQALTGGSAYRGSLEERLEALVSYLKAHPEAILFVDNLQALMHESKEDIRNALMGPIERGEISAIMNVNEDHYKEHVEPNADLSKIAEVERFDPMTLREVEDVLHSRKKLFEKHHGVLISESAIRMTAKLVFRFESSDTRARKALAILDSTAAREAIARKSGNYDKAFLKNEMASLNLRRESLEDEIIRRPQLRDELETVRNELAALEVRLQEENIKEKIEKMQTELSQKLIEVKQLEAKGDLQKAAEMKYTVIQTLEKEIRNLKVEPLPHSADITDRHVIKYYALQNKINLSVVGGDQATRLKQLEKDANERVLFQRPAVASVIERLRVRASNIEAPRPLFLLWDGPNGVGKTALAELIAELETGREPIYVDGNKYQGANSAWQLLGAGKGHVDTMSGGDLDALRLHPNSVVLIDEGNLASADFWNLLYQLGSKGVMRDMRGRLIDVRNAIVIVAGNFTQNYATFKHIWTDAQIEQKYRLPPGSLNGLTPAEKDARVLDQMLQKSGMPPGMRDRISGMVTFDAFDLPKTIAVARLQLAQQKRHIFSEHRVTVEWGEKVAEAVAKAGFDVEFNVRPIDRARSNSVSVLLAELQPSWKAGDKVKIDFEPAQDGKGGNLVAKVNEVPVSNARPVVFKSSFDPAAAAARVLGEIGKPLDPTDPANQTKAARKKGGRR
jgi:ATP-dependent Clp protease ATP-binding subunit ClpB